MKETSFSSILSALASPGASFPVRHISRFSDLNEADLNAFINIWPQVPLSRKHTLLKKLYEQFEDDTLVSFEAVAYTLLSDPDTEVRIMALKLLEESIDPAVIPGVLNVLKTDPEIQARIHAVIVLEEFIRLGELEEISPEKLTQVEDALLKAAHDENAALAREALQALGISSRPEVPPLIESALNHKEPLWQAAALLAAGHSADAKWQEPVLAGILNEDSNIRMAAVQAAGELQLAPARKMLLDMLEEEVDDDIFRTSIWSLSQIGGEDVRTYLETLLDDMEDDDAIAFIEEALDNLSFTEDMENFSMMAFDPDDIEEYDDK